MDAPKDLRVVYQLQGDWYRRALETKEFPELTDEQDLIARELGNQTDRGVAIIAGAYIEDLLSTCLKSRLHLSHKSLENRIFGRQGSLNSFSSKIDMGLALGLYQEREWRDFHTIRDIRNEFAQVSTPRTFESQRVRDLCFNLAMAEVYISQFSMEVEKSTGDRRVAGERLVEQMRENLKSARNRFIVSSIHFFSFFWAIIDRGIPKVNARSIS
jgi:hypothetical protein